MEDFSKQELRPLETTDRRRSTGVCVGQSVTEARRSVDVSGHQIGRTVEFIEDVRGCCSLQTAVHENNQLTEVNPLWRLLEIWHGMQQTVIDSVINILYYNRVIDMYNQWRTEEGVTGVRTPPIGI